MNWKVFYADGSSFGSDQGSPAMAPNIGVIAIAQADINVGCLVHQGNDWYCFDEKLYDGWGGVDSFGLQDYLSHAYENRGGPLVIKSGRLIGTNDWRNLLTKIRKDPQLPTKTARYIHERRID